MKSIQHQTLALSRSDPHACMANLYNLLPVSLKAERRYSVFQKRLKALVYDQRFYDYSEFLAFVNGHFCFVFFLYVYSVVSIFHLTILQMCTS
jgi:hypothetical protein